MSYYFDITKRPGAIPWAQLMLVVEKLFINLPSRKELLLLGIENNEEILLRGPMGTNKPICNTQRISFNGDLARGMDFESFTLLSKKMSGDCHTGFKPYDFAVCAVLILAYTHLPGIVHIKSDGNTDNWIPVFNWVRKNILPGALLPDGIESSQFQSDSGLLKQPKELNSFFDLKNIETSIQDFYFS